MNAAQARTGVISKLEALQRGASTDPVTFMVDGVLALAEPLGPRIRLSCELLPAMPPDDGEIRAIMARYLAYADHGAEVLCADEAGRVMLVAPVEADTDLPATFRDFCDAAVFWSGVVTGIGRPQRFEQSPGAMIFP